MHLFQRREADGYLHLICSICRVSMPVTNSVSAAEFQRVHAHVVPPVDPRYYGAGDALAAATGLLGIPQCAPCQERQQQANSWLPRLWRR